MTVKGSSLPGLPDGVADDAVHETASLVNSVAIRLLRRIGQTDLEATALTAPKASVLSVLVFAGPRSIGDLATIEQVTAAAMTKTVDALESASLARRRRSASDRRVVIVEATARGRTVLERGRAARIESLAGMLGDLQDEDLVAIRRAMRLLADLG